MNIGGVRSFYSHHTCPGFSKPFGINGNCLSFLTVPSLWSSIDNVIGGSSRTVRQEVSLNEGDGGQPIPNCQSDPLGDAEEDQLPFGSWYDLTFRSLSLGFH